MLIAILATNAVGRFFRAGLEFTKKAQLFDIEELGDKLDRLKVEPNLLIREPTAEELAEYQGHVETGADPAVIDELTRIIPTLEADAFGKDGAPKLDALRKAATEIDAKLIDADARDAAHKMLVNGGFIPPKATTA